MDDWATERAGQIVSIVRDPMVPDQQAVEYVAACLRLIRSEGVNEGVDRLAERLGSKS